MSKPREGVILATGAPLAKGGGLLIEGRPELSKLRLTVILAVLTLVNIVNIMDRSLMSVLAEPIKRAFMLSDTQIGILNGLAYAVVYGLIALPLSRIADRGLYRPVIAGCLALWSLLTAVGGLSQSFGQLAAMRVGVATGEAGLNPASHALISRLFAPERRGGAIAIFSLGVPLGAACGSILAGALAGAFGWRAAFFAIGPIGLALLPLLLVVPRFEGAGSNRASFDLRNVFRVLGNATYLKVWIGCAFSSMFSFGSGAFLGSFFMRVHHLSVAQVGVTLGMSSIFGLGAGAFLGGALFDFVKQRHPGWELHPSVIAMVVAALMAAAAWIVPGTPEAVAAVTAALFCYGLTAVPAMTMAQNLAREDARAAASAAMGIATGLVGATMGPLLVGVLSDHLHASAARGALTDALLTLSLALGVAAASYGLAARDLRRSWH